MALTSKISDAILGGRSQAFLSDGVNDVVLDAVLSFTEENQFAVSRHTVEEGADISDHIDSKPRKWNVTAILTDDDFDLLDPSNFFDPTIEDRFEIFETWREEKPFLNYYGHENDIEDVEITNLTKTYSDSVWTITFSITKINVATYQTADISLSTTTQKGATSKGSTSKTGAVKAKKRSSLLKGVIGG